MVKKGTDVLKEGFAKMTKGGIIMDVVNAKQAAVAEDAGKRNLNSSTLFKKNIGAKMVKIGILNLQGAVSKHYNITQKAVKNLSLDAEVESVRYSEDVKTCNGIIISGGESTTIGKNSLKKEASAK